MATVYSEDGQYYTSGGYTFESASGRQVDPVTKEFVNLTASERNNAESLKKEITVDKDDKTLEEKIKQQAKNRINRYSQRQRGGVLRYPLESLTEHTDYLQIDIEKYVPIGNSYISAPGDDNRYVRGNFQTNRAGRRSSRKLSTKNTWSI